jgi:hypothetical protein
VNRFTRRAVARGSRQQTPLTLVPLNQVFDERYAVYWKVEKA